MAVGGDSQRGIAADSQCQFVCQPAPSIGASPTNHRPSADVAACRWCRGDRRRPQREASVAQRSAVIGTENQLSPGDIRAQEDVGAGDAVGKIAGRNADATSGSATSEREDIQDHSSPGGHVDGSRTGAGGDYGHVGGRDFPPQ